MNKQNILALDVGERVIGVALCLSRGTSTAKPQATTKKNSIKTEGGKKNSIETEGGKKNPVETEGGRKNSIETEGGRKNSIETEGGRKNSIETEGGVLVPLTPIIRKDGSLGLGAIRRMINLYHPATIVIGLPKLSEMNEADNIDRAVEIDHTIEETRTDNNVKVKPTHHTHKGTHKDDPKENHKDTHTAEIDSLRNHHKTTPNASQKWEKSDEKSSASAPSRPLLNQYNQIHLPDRHQFKKIKAYSAKIRKHFPEISVQTVGEAYTTWVVKQTFPGIRKDATALGIDSFAALEILKSYLAEIHP